jgi:L,D-peptidoglycan transpeptidase YkuD (ErfK/YbiS/YcfS/YnhG family)
MRIFVTSDGRLHWAGGRAACTLGRAGVTGAKREGDGATPAGSFPLREVLYRPDRLAAPATRLPCRPLAPDDGWCDDPRCGAYNRPVKRPFAASHEALWRKDGLYDVLAVIGYNDDPVVVGAGSAIFLHVAPPDGGKTEGCVALARADLLRVLAACAPGSRIEIAQP